MIRRHSLSILAAVLAATAAAAETPMTAAEFDTFTRGKTLNYLAGGLPYGTETYLSDRRVVWAFSEDICRDGFWYEDSAQQEICFVYEHDPMPQCWRFYRWGDTIRAQFQGEDASQPLTAVEVVDGPLACPGPKVGV